MAASTIAEEPNRRDFLYVATGAMGAVGAGFAAWPLIDQMNPDATTLAAAPSIGTRRACSVATSR